MGEEKKDEEKKETQEQNGGNDEKPVPLVLKVDMHCKGCERKVRKAIISYKGVETVEFDTKLNMVTVKGNVDPLKLCERVQKKSGRKTEVLSPLPKEEIKVEEPKLEKPEPVVDTVVLEVNMHCEGCAQQVKKTILKMKGVQTVQADFTSQKVTVKGTMDPKKLVGYLHRRTGKHAQIVPPPPPPPPPPPIEDGKKEAEEVKQEEDKKEEEKKEEKKEEAKPEEGEKKASEESGGEVKKEAEKVEGEEKKEVGDQPVKEAEPGEEKKEDGGETVVVSSVEEKKNEFYAPRYVIEHVYPPQLFSDENPNACSVM